MSDRDVDLVAKYADVMQVGARNMQNFMLLKELGKCGRPVLLKRGLSSTVKELLMSAEYVTAHGNADVILCERGIRTFETVTRNTCDIAAIPALNELTHLPVVLDPSHATGKRSSCGALSRRRGDWRRRINRRSASRAGKGHQRRRTIAGHCAVPKDDERPGAVHFSCGTSREERSCHRGKSLAATNNAFDRRPSEEEFRA